VQFFSVIFMDSLIQENQPELTAGYSPAVLSVDDPVFVYIVDMITQLGDMASNAGHAHLGRRLTEVVAAARP
jgi:hypothetical protein